MPLPQVVSHTIQAVTAADTEQLVVRRKSDGTLQAVGYFACKDAGGNVVDNRSVSIDLTGPQTTAIASFITSNVVPAMNAQ